MGTRGIACAVALAVLAFAAMARAEDEGAAEAAFAFDLENPVFERLLERAASDAKPILLDFYLPG